MSLRPPSRPALLALAAALVATPAPARDDRALAREVLAELVEIDTSVHGEASRRAAEAVAARLRAGGIPAADVQLLGPEPERVNVVARLRGTGEDRPILLMCHLDVVPAHPEDWSFDPFAFLERDGWFYGRGTSDNKAGCTTLVVSLARLVREGFRPRRDLIAAFTADEETDARSIRWLLAERRALVDAEYALNSDAGYGALEDGVPRSFAVQASEKVYMTLELEATHPGGHSSIPVPGNPLHRVAAAVARLARHEFPVRLNEITRAYLLRSAETESGRRGADLRALAESGSAEAAARLSRESPVLAAMLRTTCVATMAEAGHAENALPQRARVTVNCRVLPDHDPDEVEAALREVIADPEIALRRTYEPVPSPPSPLRADVLGAIETLVAERWPGIPVIPSMSTGATDGLFVRNAGIPVYGVSAIFDERDDVRAHGRDERVGVEALHDAIDFWVALLRRLAGPGA